VRPLMGVCPQFDVLWGELTGREHLMIYGHVKGVPFSKVGGCWFVAGAGSWRVLQEVFRLRASPVSQANNQSKLHTKTPTSNRNPSSQTPTFPTEPDPPPGPPAGRRPPREGQADLRRQHAQRQLLGRHEAAAERGHRAAGGPADRVPGRAHHGDGELCRLCCQWDACVWVGVGAYIYTG
jgi:hypothetical protein